MSLFRLPPFCHAHLFAWYVCSVTGQIFQKQMFAIKFCLKFSLDFFLFHIYVLQCISVLELSQFAVFWYITISISAFCNCIFDSIRKYLFVRTNLPKDSEEMPTWPQRHPIFLDWRPMDCFLPPEERKLKKDMIFHHCLLFKRPAKRFMDTTWIWISSIYLNQERPKGNPTTSETWQWS